MVELDKKLLQKIKKENIKPIPKHHFFLRKSFFWFMALLSILFGAVSFGMILLQSTNIEWEFFNYFHTSFRDTFFLLLLPTIWLVISAFFIALGVVHYRQTAKGYRLNLPILVGIILILSLLGGYGIYKTGLSAWSEHVALRQIPLYRQIHQHAAGVWMNPDQGFLMGTVTGAPTFDDQTFPFNAVDASQWQVKITANTILRGQITVTTGTKVRVIGKRVNENQNIFEAHEIRPWPGEGPGRRGGMGRGKPGMMRDFKRGQPRR